MARADRLGIGGPFPAFVNLDDKQNDQYILNITQGGIGMPDRDYYLKTDAKIAENRGEVSRVPDEDADARGRDERSPRAPRPSSTSKRKSPAPTGPRSRAAMRPRPITR